MGQDQGRTIAVVGSTGLQGRAVTRRLLQHGWHVRALTRNPDSKQARALAALGADVIRTDSADEASLERSFAGTHGVYSVQNHHISGYDGEITQGKNVAEAVARTGVRHLVYASAGTGLAGTGIGSWETKVVVTEHARQLGIPLTVFRPMAFTELMTERRFYPAASVWHLMPKLMGESRPVGWLSVEDLAVIAEKAFADPDAFVGRDVALASDVQSIEECRAIWRDVLGRSPRRFPMPVWSFERFSGTDETTMWRWLRHNDVDLDTQPTRAIHPEALTVRAWLASRKRASGRGARGNASSADATSQ
ncbi:MAG: NmrA/HSCARG family protein [Actinomycetota bacterium]|nr:NmrA/HSCARG family protein [Actinomycetota bacterium]